MQLYQHPVFIYRWGLTVCLVVITYLATAPQDFPTVGTFSDKLNHVGAFLVLSWLVDFSLPQTQFTGRKMAALLSYGILLEIIQLFLPDRMFSVFDICADQVGIVLYIAAVPLLKKSPYLKRRWHKPAVHMTP